MQRPRASMAWFLYGVVALMLVGRPAVVRAQGSLARAAPNDNRIPAGEYVRDTLVLRLTVAPVKWYFLGDGGPAFTLLAFAEEGKQPTIPGPLVRVRQGTAVRVSIRNPLDDTLVVRGFTAGAAATDSLVVLPGQVDTSSFVASREGAYVYWVPAYSLRIPDSLEGVVPPRAFDSQLGGAIVVDPPGHVPPDRILVLTELTDRNEVAGGAPLRDRHGVLPRQFNAVNGRSWPHTERLRYALGDSIRWRIVNASQEAHPMHLHGFFFRVDSHGTPQSPADSIYTADQRRMAVTETVASRHTATITWSPDRAGAWLFHCHLTTHTTLFAPVDHRDVIEYPSAHHEDPDSHALTGMNGLVLGVTVTGATPRRAESRPVRRLRLFVQSDSTDGDVDRRFGYVLQRRAEPRRDSIEYPGPVLLLTRGEPTSIEVVNRSPEATAVHWHGIELDSYYDGVAGWSGTRGHVAPAIRPGGRFTVHLTPKRAGTFMYHTHLDDVRQQYGGLVGPLIVLEPGERWDPERDLVFMLTDGIPGRMYINGSLTPAPRTLEVGKSYRLRIADIAVFRQALRVRLLRDSAPARWRPVAKDGFTLPAAQATARAAVTNLPSGETADFEFTPTQPGEYVLEVALPVGPPQGTLRLRVLGAASADTTGSAEWLR